MRRFEDGEILSKSPDFKILENDSQFYFVHTSGQKVQTDKLGQYIWSLLPRQIDNLVETVQKEFDIDLHQIEKFIFIFCRANLVTSSRDTQEKDIPLSLSSEQVKVQISIIVVTYNGENHIQDCFHSICRQAGKNVEVIAVDNASQDNTVKILQNTFPQVKVHSLKKNIHFAGAVNYGILHSQGQYIFILNQDIELNKNCLRKIYEKAESTKEAGAVVPMMKFFHLRGFINGIGNHIRDFSWGSDNFIGCVDIGQFEDLFEVPSACFGAVLLKREAVDQIGLLDRKYTAFYEDTDWSFRCWLKGWTIVPSTEAIVYHKFGASYPGMRKLRLVVRNRMRLVLKIFQGRIRFRFLRKYMKEDFKNMFSLVKKRQFKNALAYTQAYVSLFFSLPDISWKRHHLLGDKYLRERDVLDKNPDIFSCLNTDGQPVVDLNTFRVYYSREFERIESQKN
ncbi:MAG: glycosyltransferase family 2 protein [Candidatus Aminicenantes bacterium]|nr:glycosyltransferase family 2 protein [Candidatus Aminicenantes bacterium]